jgi:tRNA A22 N-methylase
MQPLVHHVGASLACLVQRQHHVLLTISSDHAWLEFAACALHHFVAS